MRPPGSNIFNCHNSKGVKLLTRLRLGQSHLLEHKFQYSLQVSYNLICSCGKDIQKLTHLLFHCANYSNERSTFQNIISIDRKTLKRNDIQVTEILLYGDSNSINIINTGIQNVTIDSLSPRDLTCVSFRWLNYIINFQLALGFAFLHINIYFYTRSFEIDICLMTVIFMFLGVSF